MFFGFLVFSVCVAIYFEYRGREILCPNGGDAKSPAVANAAKPDAHAAKPDAHADAHADANAAKPDAAPTPTPTPSGADSSYTCYVLILFVIALKMLRFNTFCYCA